VIGADFAMVTGFDMTSWTVTVSLISFTSYVVSWGVQDRTITVGGKPDYCRFDSPAEQRLIRCYSQGFHSSDENDKPFHQTYLKLRFTYAFIRK